MSSYKSKAREVGKTHYKNTKIERVFLASVGFEEGQQGDLDQQTRVE